MKTSKRLVALIAAFAIIFSFIFSSLFIIENSHHKCSGSECSICAMLHCAKDNINAVKSDCATLSIFLPASFFGIILLLGKVIKVNSKTLIDLSVKITA